MCVTIPLGFLLNGEWHYGSEEMLVRLSAINMHAQSSSPVECEICNFFLFIAGAG